MTPTLSTLATSTWDTVTGLNWLDLVAFVKLGLVQTYWGGLLAFLDAIWGWALISFVIAACLLLVAAAFRFFRH